MILANGMIYDSGEQNRILSTLEHRINETILHQPLSTETVIAAFDELSSRLKRGDFYQITQKIQLENMELPCKRQSACCGGAAWSTK
ncbi:MAG: hypothetical protein II341_06230 [Oscillospiraceae bacterium]|nr:hypothetical protein [Oscillospiraceae bacterium]